MAATTSRSASALLERPEVQDLIALTRDIAAVILNSLGSPEGESDAAPEGNANLVIAMSGLHAAGVLALPVLAISSNLFNLNSLEEGLFGTRITFLGNGVGIHRYAYGYAASDKEEDAGVLARAAFDGAMAMAKEIVEK